MRARGVAQHAFCPQPSGEGKASQWPTFGRRYVSASSTKPVDKRAETRSPRTAFLRTLFGPLLSVRHWPASRKSHHAESSIGGRTWLLKTYSSPAWSRPPRPQEVANLRSALRAGRRSLLQQKGRHRRNWKTLPPPKPRA